MSTEHPDIVRGTRWDRVPAREWRNLVNDVSGPANIHGGPGILVTRVGEHFSISAWPQLMQLLNRGRRQPTAGAGGVVEPFQVLTRQEQPDPEPMQDDYVYAKRLLSDDSTGIKVAKPYRLRKTPWDGKTVRLSAFRVSVTYEYFPPSGAGRNQSFKRYATRDDEPFLRETQTIWPEYVITQSAHPSKDIILAVHLGEEGTMVEGVEWEELGSERGWKVLPQEFVG